MLIIGNDIDFNDRLSNDVERFFRYARITNFLIRKKKLNYHHFDEYFDLCFIDLKASQIDQGLKLIEEMKLLKKINKVICISDCNDLVFPLFVINPYYFIRKNDYEEDIRQFLKVFLKEQKHRERIYVLHSKYEKTVIDLSHVLYIFVDDHKLSLHTLTAKYEEYGSLKTFMENYSDLFIQVNRGCVINLRFIIKYTTNKITMWDETEIDVGKVYQNTLLEQLQEYYADY